MDVGNSYLPNSESGHMLLAFRRDLTALDFNLVRATRIEFEYRFWIIAAIYALGFSFGRLDISVIAALRHVLAPGIGPNRDAAASFARSVIAAGALLVFATAILRTWATAYLRSEVVHDTRQHSDALVADGPYRFTRNPLYLANVPMAAGIGVLSSRLGWFFLVGASWFFVYRLIFREEEALQQSQGESYRAYCAAVPRFWPSFRPRVPPSGRAAHWGQALIGESFIWIFGIAQLAMAVTLSTSIGLIVFAAGFVAHFTLIPLVRNNPGKRLLESTD